MGMAKLDELLAEAEATNIKMREAAASKTEDGARGVIGLRTKFAELMAQSVAAMHADQRLKDNPGVRREFETRFFALRQKLAHHQAKWRKSLIDSDPAGYRASVEELNALQDAFYPWAKEELAKL
jgi:hypothetical protein